MKKSIILIVIAILAVAALETEAGASYNRRLRKAPPPSKATFKAQSANLNITQLSMKAERRFGPSEITKKQAIKDFIKQARPYRRNAPFVYNLYLTYLLAKAGYRDQAIKGVNSINMRSPQLDSGQRLLAMTLFIDLDPKSAAKLVPAILIGLSKDATYAELRCYTVDALGAFMRKKQYESAQSAGKRMKEILTKHTFGCENITKEDFDQILSEIDQILTFKTYSEYRRWNNTRREELKEDAKHGKVFKEGSDKQNTPHKEPSYPKRGGGF